MAEDDKIVTITVDGPRASGVTRISDLIQKLVDLQYGDSFPKCVIRDMSKERDGHG